ncbi:MAG: PPC domain-containing protein [Treponema sp.]|nr:PPC domain-containing protein [Treponema sp.]
MNKKNQAVFAAVFLLFLTMPLFSQAQSLAELDRESGAAAEKITQHFRGAGRTVSVEIAFFASSGIETPLGNYWRQNLISLLSGTGGFTVFSSAPNVRGDYVLSGEILDLGEIVRIYTRLSAKDNSAVLASWTNDLEKTPALANLLVTESSSRHFSVPRDAYEEDSWENPIAVIIDGQVISRTIHLDDQDWHLIRPERNMLAVMETFGPTDTVMELYDKERNRLALDDDSGEGENARIEYFLEGGKPYIAMVRGYGRSDTGPYQFSVREIPLPPNRNNQTQASAFPLERREVESFLTPGDQHWYSFTLPNEARVRIYTRGRVVTLLFLNDDSGRELARSEDSESQGGNARIIRSLESGTYYIMVQGNGRNAAGAYFLFTRIQEQTGDEYDPDDTPEQAKEIKIGETQRRIFIDGDDADWVFFTAETAGIYRITARGERSGQVDTYLELFDNNLRLIAEDDDGGPGYSSQLRQRLNPGRYYLRISYLDDEPEYYLLRVEEN